jgi:hypothetical protein
MKIKHIQWGIGTVLYELSGGYQLLVNFDNYGKIQVQQKDCEEVQDVELVEKQDVELEKTNEKVQDVELELELELVGSIDKAISYYKSEQNNEEIQDVELVEKQDVELEKTNEKVQDVELVEKQDVELEKTNENISKFIDIVKKNQNGILKNEIISKLDISKKTFNETFQKVIRLPEYHFTQNEQDTNNFGIKFVPKIEISDSSEKKKIVEAFRLGVVPTFAVKDITVGREKEIKKVEKWLAKDSESLMIIGQYGQGKSHIIRYIKEKALDEGYLIGYCDIGNESNMHQPKSVFNTLMKSLEFRYKKDEKNNDLGSFLKLYAYFNRKQFVDDKDTSKFLNPGINELIDKLQQGYKINELTSKNFTSFVDYLCGDEDMANSYRFRGSSIQNYQTAASIICNILSSIGNMTASMNNSENNFKGLILIFDEGETIDSSFIVSRKREGGINFIKGLVEISNNNEDLLSESHKERNSINQYYGKKTNLVYSGMQQDIGFCNQKENHVKCLFAFVEGESEVIDILEKRKVEKIILNEFSDTEKNKLIIKVVEIYEKAYNYKENNIKKLIDIIMRKLESSEDTRSIIKITMEAIELIRQAGLEDPDDEINYEKILR